MESIEEKVVQEAVKSSNVTQIATQNNFNGLTPSDALDMALKIFGLYYPQLREDLLSALRKDLEKEVYKIKTENICIPTAKILIPALENASITEESDLRTMYAKLIAKDMDKSTKEQVHPSFVEIINNMNAHDAKLFMKIAKINNNIPIAHVKIGYDDKIFLDILPHYFSTLFDDFDPWKASISIENLSRLGLFDISVLGLKSFDYSSMERHPFVLNAFKVLKQYHPDKNLKINVDPHAISISDFGKRFARACL